MMKNKIALVAGFSSTGKSTFIKHVLTPSLYALPNRPDAHSFQVVFGGSASDTSLDFSKNFSIVHYNALVGCDNNVEQLDQLEYSSEPALQSVLGQMKDQYAFLTYTPDPILEARIKARKFVEPEYIQDTTPYPSANVLQVLSQVSQRKLLLEIADQLRSKTDKIFVVVSGLHSAIVVPEFMFRTGQPNALLEAVLTGRSIGNEDLLHFAHHYDEFVFSVARHLSLFQTRVNSELRAVG